MTSHVSSRASGIETGAEIDCRGRRGTLVLMVGGETDMSDEEEMVEELEALRADLEGPIPGSILIADDDDAELAVVLESILPCGGRGALRFDVCGVLVVMAEMVAGADAGACACGGAGGGAVAGAAMCLALLGSSLAAAALDVLRKSDLMVVGEVSGVAVPVESMPSARMRTLRSRR